MHAMPRLGRELVCERVGGEEAVLLAWCACSWHAYGLVCIGFKLGVFPTRLVCVRGRGIVSYRS